MKPTGRVAALAGLVVVELEALDVLLFDAEDLFDDGVVEELDLRVGDGALEHDACRRGSFRVRLMSVTLVAKRVRKSASSMAESPPPMTAISLPRGEEAVAGGAGADAVADEGLLGGQAEPAGGGAGGDDERAGVDDLAVPRLSSKGVLAEVDGGRGGHA